MLEENSELFSSISLTDYSQGNSFTGRCHVSVKKLTEMMCVVEKTGLLTELVGGGGGEGREDEMEYNMNSFTARVLDRVLLGDFNF